MHLVSSMAYVNDTPVARPRQPARPNQPIEVWKKQCGMDWSIEEAEVRFVSRHGGLIPRLDPRISRTEGALPQRHKVAALRRLIALSGSTAGIHFGVFIAI